MQGVAEYFFDRMTEWQNGIHLDIAQLLTDEHHLAPTLTQWRR